MSTLYIANTGSVFSAGVWRVSSSDYQYQYAAFTPGEDVNLDLVSIRTNTYTVGQSAPDNFRVGIYAAGVDSSTPGSLITYLSGPGSPTAGEYNDYRASSVTSLASGSQYWLGFTLASDTGGTNSTRVRLAANNGNFTTLGAGWSAASSRYVMNSSGIGNGTQPEALVYSLYATPVCFAKGTLISMPDGSTKAIEHLEIGDVVSTSKGALPIKWVAKQTIPRSCRTYEKYKDSLPVRIEAGALGCGLPFADLLVSESHDLHVDERIVTAAHLVNELNIYKDPVSAHPIEVRYFHLEFEDEVLVFANGVGACSYVNSGNRRSFDNYPEFITRYIDAESSVRSLVSELPRNEPLLEGHKQRIRRSWQNV